MENRFQWVFTWEITLEIYSINVGNTVGEVLRLNSGEISRGTSKESWSLNLLRNSWKTSEEIDIAVIGATWLKGFRCQLYSIDGYNSVFFHVVLNWWRWLAVYVHQSLAFEELSNEHVINLYHQLKGRCSRKIFIQAKIKDPWMMFEL